MPDLSALIQKIHLAAQREWTRSARESGLSNSEFLYIEAVHEQACRQLRSKDEHGQHLQDIVLALDVTKASASAMILKLEQRGLIRRIPCQLDARAQHIILTEEGQALRTQGLAVYAAIAETLRQHLSDDDLQELNSLTD